MERRTRKYGRRSQETPEVQPKAPPPSKRHHQLHHEQKRPQRVPVVYYLCRSRHLEHPHFIEVPTSSPEGLYLRDVISRMNGLRGKGMATMYSWSCKRSYKSGFVWHDLCEDDLILPVNGNEYVLKGSEILDGSPADPARPAATAARSQSSKRPSEDSPSPSSSGSQNASPSSLGVVVPEERAPLPPSLPYLHTPPPEDEQSPGDVSPPSKLSPQYGGAAGGSSPSPEDYGLQSAVGAADASTQTEELERRPRKTRGSRETRAIVVSTDPGLELNDPHKSRTPPRQKESSEISRDEISPPPISSSSSGGATETLESLIRAEAQRMNRFRILEEEDLLAHSSPKQSATNMLMQLITCGSISVKSRHNIGFVPTYKPRFHYANYCYSSPVPSTSVILGELDGAKNGCNGCMMVEPKRHNEGGEEAPPTHSSPCDSGRGCESPLSANERDRLSDSGHLKCLSKAAKSMAAKRPKSETVKSPLSDSSSNSLSGQNCRGDWQEEYGKRIADACSMKGSSMRQESFLGEREKVIKIEESSLLGLGS